MIRPGLALRGREAARQRSVTKPDSDRASPFSINIAPMIDMTFLLLIFFLVTTTFERAEGILASQLPRDTGAPSVALPISPIIVELVETGPNGGDYTILIRNVPEAPADFEALAVMLRQIQGRPGFDDETPVVIKADPQVRWDHVVNAWNAAVRCRFKNIVFSG